MDVHVINRDDHIVTGLSIKDTDTHQYRHTSLCHLFHSKRSIPYRQLLQLNRICSEGEFFDHRYNEVEIWLNKCEHNVKMMRARKFSRNEFLDKEQNRKCELKLIFNIIYHPPFSRMKNIWSKIHILLKPNEEHRKVFDCIPSLMLKKVRVLRILLFVPDYQKLMEMKEKASKNIGSVVKFAGL